MKIPASLLLVLLAASCGGQKIKNHPADMPGSPDEAESMFPSNSPDKAPPDPSQHKAEAPSPALEAEPPEPSPAEPTPATQQSVGPQPAAPRLSLSLRG